MRKSLLLLIFCAVSGRGVGCRGATHTATPLARRRRARAAGRSAAAAAREDRQPCDAARAGRSHIRSGQPVNTSWQFARVRARPLHQKSERRHSAHLRPHRRRTHQARSGPPTLATRAQALHQDVRLPDERVRLGQDGRRLARGARHGNHRGSRRGRRHPLQHLLGARKSAGKSLSRSRARQAYQAPAPRCADRRRRLRREPGRRGDRRARRMSISCSARRRCIGSPK